MRVFVDCEFTDMQRLELLSMALVAANGRELYVEMTSRSVHAKASNFAQDMVLAQFGMVPAAKVKSMVNVGHLVADFLDSLGGMVAVCADYADDLMLVELALTAAGRLAAMRRRLVMENVAEEVLADDAQDLWDEAYDAEEVGFASQGALLNRHHALLDARALRRVFAGVRERTALQAG